MRRAPVVRVWRVCDGQRVIDRVATPSLRSSLLLVLGLVALIAVACGGGDEEPDATATPTEAPTEAATEAATPPPTEEPEATEPPATEPAEEAASPDEVYLRGLCIAGNHFQAAMFTAALRMETEQGLEDDPEAFAALFLEPMASLFEALQEVTPPDDVADFHNGALAQYEALIRLFEAMREAAEEGEGVDDDPFELLGGMLAGAEEMPTLPEAARVRLAEVAAGIPECSNSLFLEGFLGADGSEPVDTGSDVEALPEDEAYVRELCLAGDAYDATIARAIAGLGPDAELDDSDPEVFAAVFREGLRGLAADLALIAPPDAVAEYHDASIARFQEMVDVLDGIMEALDAGQEVTQAQLTRFQELLGDGIGMPGLPFDVANRLAQAANSVIECYNSGFLLGFLGGGG